MSITSKYLNYNASIVSVIFPDLIKNKPKIQQCSLAGCYVSKTIERLAEEINLAFPEMKRISKKRGLYRMIQFYETYAGNEIVSPLVSQISWTNNIVFFLIT